MYGVIAGKEIKRAACMICTCTKEGMSLVRERLV